MPKKKLIANEVPRLADNRSIMEHIADLPPDEQLKMIDHLVEKYCDGDPTQLKYKWELYRRGNQWFPDHDKWKHCLFLAGRGFGKTRVGAEITRFMAETGKAKRIGIVAPTAHDATAVCLYGESGLITISPDSFRPVHHPTYKKVTWPDNKCIAYLFALDITTEIPTPDGFKSLSDIHVGDRVFDETGNPCTVTYETPVMLGNKCYELTFKNGQKITCDKDHLWRISTLNQRYLHYNKGKEYKYKTVTTEYIANNLREDNKHNDLNNWVRLTSPVVYDEKDLAIPSYVLGAWLGDGDSNSGMIASKDRELVAEIEAHGYTVTHNEKYPIVWYVRKLITQLKALGVYRNKHIPDVYKKGSIEQRLSLLQGLMDTDGTITKTGEMVFSNTNENLVDGVCEVVASLGGWTTKRLCTPRKGNPYGPELPIWKVSIRKVDRLFRLPRKLERMRNRRRYFDIPIVDIREVESVPVKCIRVDSESHLFLATKSYLPTHNSAEDPESLRGHQFDFLWADELAAWTRGMKTWEQIIAVLRLGKNPRSVITTTPKANDLIKTIAGNPKTWTITGSTYENANNIALDEMAALFEGTRMGKQELYGEILEAAEGALWKESEIEATRVKDEDVGNIPDMVYKVIAVDPAMTTTKRADETGICVAGYGEDGHYYILYADSHKDTSGEWAKRVFDLYDEHMCNTIVVETNNGGDMVKENLTKLRSNAVVYGVHTKKGKYLRAEPVHHLYELKKVHHVGSWMLKAEEQMTQFDPIGNPDGDDDIVDALTYAVTALFEKATVSSVYMPAVGGVRKKLMDFSLR